MLIAVSIRVSQQTGGPKQGPGRGIASSQQARHGF
jgi:hypothetical protein